MADQGTRRRIPEATVARLSRSYPLEAIGEVPIRGKAQALNDFLVFGTTASCSFLAGVLQHNWGWFPLNWMSVILVAIAVVAVGWLRLSKRTVAA